MAKIKNGTIFNDNDAPIAEMSTKEAAKVSFTKQSKPIKSHTSPLELLRTNTIKSDEPKDAPPKKKGD